MKDIIKIILGNILVSFSYAFLTVPKEIINGGVTSLSLILHSFVSIRLGMITNILTIILLIICLIFLGKEYFFKSILGSICYMSFFNLFYSLSIPINLNIITTITLASILIALGYYLCISANSSTVGLDVIALILNKKNNKIDIAISLRYLNICVLFLGFLVFGYSSIIKGLVFTWLYSAILKLLFKRVSHNKTSLAT